MVTLRNWPDKIISPVIFEAICQSTFVLWGDDHKATQENKWLGVPGVFGNRNATKDHLWNARS